jgi:hypothetical protein
MMSMLEGLLGKFLKRLFCAFAGGLPMTRPSSISWCRFTPLGLMMGPSRGSRMDVGGLRKKNG